jgi:hypothetical protein
MAAYVKFYQFIEDLHKGVHNLTSDATSTLTVALCNAANAPDQNADLVLADIVQIAYTNLSARVITGVGCEQTTGVCHVTGTDLVLTASGAVATFRYVVIYNDDPTSPADPLICYYDHGSDVTLANGETYTIDFPTDIWTAS